MLKAILIRGNLAAAVQKRISKAVFEPSQDRFLLTRADMYEDKPELGSVEKDGYYRKALA